MRCIRFATSSDLRNFVITNFIALIRDETILSKSENEGSINKDVVDEGRNTRQSFATTTTL